MRQNLVTRGSSKWRRKLNSGGEASNLTYHYLCRKITHQHLLLVHCYRLATTRGQTINKFFTQSRPSLSLMRKRTNPMRRGTLTHLWSNRKQLALPLISTWTKYCLKRKSQLKAYHRASNEVSLSSISSPASLESRSRRKSPSPPCPTARKTLNLWESWAFEAARSLLRWSLRVNIFFNSGSASSKSPFKVWQAL